MSSAKKRCKKQASVMQPMQDDSSDSSSDEDMDDKKEEFENINVEFEAESPVEDDFHGLKQLLLRVLLTLRVNVSGLCDLIIKQQDAGSTIKIADDEDSEVYGVLTALSLKQDKGCLNELKNELIKKSLDQGLDEEIGRIFSTKHVGYLVNERFINIPGQIAVPLHSTLLQEIEEAKSKTPFDFDYLMLISKTLKPTKSPSDNNTKTKTHSKKNETKKKANEDEFMEYTNFEDELYHEACELSFSYSVTEATGLAVSGDWDFKDTPMKTFRTVMFVQQEKWKDIVNQIPKMVE